MGPQTGDQGIKVHKFHIHKLLNSVPRSIPKLKFETFLPDESTIASVLVPPDVLIQTHWTPRSSVQNASQFINCHDIMIDYLPYRINVWYVLRQ